MKDAMGELNMTVIVIVAIGAISAFFIGFLWPQIKDSIGNSWNKVDTTWDNEGNVSFIIPNHIADYFHVPNIYE